MTPLDVAHKTTKAFNWLFFMALFLLITAGAFLTYATVVVGSEYDSLLSSQKQFGDRIRQQISFDSFSCSIKQYSDDVLLRKINNTTEPLTQDYVPENLVAVPAGYVHPRVGSQSVRSDVLEPLQDMLDQARTDGLNLRLNSAYRSYARQAEVYERNTIDQFITKPERAARPGYSEHQLGTAVDISLYPNNGQAGYAWLRENAYRYGFVLSYPDGAEDVTEFLYEPWHWRYVGKDIARHIHENNMLFNHEKTMLLPSPGDRTTELAYEYQGRDLWIFKHSIAGDKQEVIVRGVDEPVYATDISELISFIQENTVTVGGVEISGRKWVIADPVTTYIGHDNKIWERTSFAMSQKDQDIERLELLYRDDFGYMVIAYQTQQAGDRLVKEFTRTCRVR